MSAVFNVKGNVYIEKQIEIKGGAVQFIDNHNDQEKQLKNSAEMIIPAEFHSEKALAIYEKLKAAKILDDQLQPLCSRPKAALLAQEISNRLGIKHTWTIYEKMWHRDNMRNDLQKALERKETGDYVSTIREALK